MKKLTIALLILCIMAISVNAATITITNPVTGGDMNGTAFNVTATISSIGLGENITNCTFSTSADGQFGISVLGNVTSYENITDTTALTEATASTITLTCYNNSGDASWTGTSTNVNIDNTNPVCSCSTEREFLNVLNDFEVDCGDSTDVTSLNSTCIATYDDSSTETVAKQNLNTLSTFSNTAVLGDVSVSCAVIDEVGRTNTCSAISIRLQGNGDEAAAEAAKSEEKKTNVGLILLILGALVVVAIGIVIITTQKKKKRK